MELSFTLTQEEINYILQVLSTRPYNEVQDLIPKLAVQGNAALEAMQKPQEEEPIK